MKFPKKCVSVYNFLHIFARQEWVQNSKTHVYDTLLFLNYKNNCKLKLTGFCIFGTIQGWVAKEIYMLPSQWNVVTSKAAVRRIFSK